MATVRRSRTSLEAQPPRFTEEVRANLQAMSEEEIAQRAASDPDNLLLNDSELARLAAIRAVRRARERTGLSQAKFAERYWINPARLRDWEQGRYPPDSVALAYLAVIARDPEAVARALAES